MALDWGMSLRGGGEKSFHNLRLSEEKREGSCCCSFWLSTCRKRLKEGALWGGEEGGNKMKNPGGEKGGKKIKPLEK